MKKIFAAILFLLFMSSGVQSAVLNYEQALEKNNKTPMAVLIYADWAADYQTILNQFKIVERELAGTYNFVELNVCSKDMKLYNEKYLIYTNLPYIMAYRTNGKFAQIIDRDCAKKSACIVSKLKTFAR